MHTRRLFFFTAVVFFWSALAHPASVAAQEAQKHAFKCVKRTADQEPPRDIMPTLRAEGGREQEYRKPVKLEPMCREGEVPVPEFPDKRHFIKGNPLLGPYAAPGPAHPLPGEFVNRNLLLQFDQVYWKRDGRTPQASAARSIPDSCDPPCNGVAWFGSCFFYATAAEQRTADGGGMTYTIESPVLDNSGDNAGHSIGEIAVMNNGTAGSNLNDVEMGFSVSPDQWGDTHPHLFVYHWINGNETCYNTCAWNQVSSTYTPGMDLSRLVGQNVYIGWVHFREAWWGWFNDEWLGYIKDSEWSGTFTQSESIQWY